MKSTLHAGYVLPGVFEALLNSGMISREELRALLEGWCAMDVESDGDLAGGRPLDDAVLLTAANLVSRGLPTLPGVDMQQLVDRCFARTETRMRKGGRIGSGVKGFSPAVAENFLDVLRAVDPRVSEDDVLKPLAAGKAAALLKLLLPLYRDLFGSAVSHLLTADDEKPALLLTFPVPLNGIKGIRAFSVKKDRSPTAGPAADDWFDLPVATSDSKELAVALKQCRKLLPDTALPLVLQDARMLKPEGLEELQLLLAPLAAARVQAAFLALVLQGKVDLASGKVRIVVIERDVPAAALAFADLERLLTSLFVLEGSGRKTPSFELTVHSRGAFATSKLHTACKAAVIQKSDQLPDADCCIDVSMLLRSGFLEEDIPCAAPVKVRVRSARGLESPRRLHFGSTKAWLPPEKEGTAQGGAPLRAAAMEDLFRRLFRYHSLRSGQQKLLEQLLQQKSVLLSKPAGSGKSLLTHFAGMLQPAPTLVIAPLSSVVMDQRDMLREHFIDADSSMHDSLGKEERLAVLRQFLGRESLICHLTAELFRNDEVVDSLKQMSANGVVFSQCIIEEAHALSEWSHDFRANMQLAPAFAAGNLPAGKGKTLPLRLLTGCISFDALEDLRRQLRDAGRAYDLPPAQIVREDHALNPSSHYYILPVEHQAADVHDTAEARKNILRSFLPQLPAFFEELQDGAPPEMRLSDSELRHFFEKGRSNTGILFCPEPSGPMGVTNRFSPGSEDEGVAEALANVENLRPGIFIGKDDGMTHMGRQILADSDAERHLLRDGERNLLVSTRAYGIGTDHAGIRYTLHLSMPAGISRFVQESGRSGRDGRLSLAALLYAAPRNNQSPDAAHALGVLQRSVSLPEREKQLLHDLLREISYPEDSNTGRIANMIADEFGVDLRVSYWQRGLDERMYLQEGGSSYGYVDLVTQEIVPDPKHPAPAFAKKLLEFAHATSLEAAGSGPSLSSWVSATFPSDIDDGIFRQMKDFDSGATFTLRIGFENDREPLLNQIHQILWREAEIQIQRKLLSEITAVSWGDFRLQLEERSNKPGALEGLSKDLRTRVLHFFNKLRTREDTERVIQRLATLGVVRDYTVNKAARKFSLTIAVRSEEEYRDALARYMRISLPETHVARLLDALPSYTGDSMLERCLYFLVDFSYQHPLQRQNDSVRELDAACRYGLEQGPAAFRDYLDLTLRAKYARNDALPAALAAKPLNRFSVIESYIRLLEGDESGSILANADHLRASTELLSATMKNEPLLTALHAFARLLLATSAKGADSARKRFIDQVALCAAVEDRRGESYLQAIAAWLQPIRRYFTQDETGKLREGLEAASSRIARTSDVAAPATAPQTTAAPAAMPDITATRPALKAVPPPAEPARQEQVDAAPAPADEAASPTQVSSASEEDILRELEKEFENRVPAAEQKHGGADDGTRTGESQGSAPKKKSRDASPGDSSRTGAQTRKSSTDLEIDSLLADIEGTLTKKTAPPAPARVNIPAKANIDPILTEHLKWLKTFNTTFLNAYESRNASLSAGTRKRA